LCCIHLWSENWQELNVQHSVNICFWWRIKNQLANRSS
jgi:hypothetical protein